MDAQAWSVITKAMELSKVGKMLDALDVLDKFLDEEIKNNRANSIQSVCGTAAVMADAMGDQRRVRQYYEQSLSHIPDDAQALYGIARSMLLSGETSLAEEYAARSYRLCKQGGTKADVGLADFIVKQWPRLDQGS